MAIDDPIFLSDVLEPSDLRDVLRSFASMHGVAVTVVECRENQFDLLTTTFDAEGSPRAGSGPPPHSIDEIRAAMLEQVGPIVLDRDSGGTRDERLTLFVVPLVHQGELLARIAIGPYRRGEPARDAALDPTQAIDDRRAELVAKHVAAVLDVLIHNAYARFLTSTMHTEIMEANFAELSAKNRHLEKAVEHMQEVDRLKSSFLATMSHELRTPLTSVIGYSEMLIEGLAGELNRDQREYLKTILGKAEQLLQLISGILEASVLESGSVEIRREPVTMPDLIESVLATVRPTLRERRISFVKHGDRLPRALGDREKIRQIVRALLANAIKFTPEGSDIRVSLGTGPMRPSLAISTDEEVLAAAGELGLQLAVVDSGIGIPPDEQARIFDPFFQVDSSSTRRYGGPGLGLTLAKRYVEVLGGSIWVESSLGSGSTFTVSLPVVPQDLNELPGTGARQPDGRTSDSG